MQTNGQKGPAGLFHLSRCITRSITHMTFTQYAYRIDCNHNNKNGLSKKCFSKRFHITFYLDTYNALRVIEIGKSQKPSWIQTYSPCKPDSYPCVPNPRSRVQTIHDGGGERVTGAGATRPSASSPVTCAHGRGAVVHARLWSSDTILFYVRARVTGSPDARAPVVITIYGRTGK